MPRFVRSVSVAALALVCVQCDPTSPALQSLVLSLCGSPGAVPWVAYQNEGGPWTPVSLSPTASTTLQVTPKVGLALSLDFFGPVTIVFYATAGELQKMIRSDCPDGAAKTVNGTVAGLTQSQNAAVLLGTASTYLFSGGTMSFSLSNVPPGALDLLALTGGAGTRKVIMRRGVNADNGASLPVIDFAATEAVNAASAVVAVTGLQASEFAYPSISFRSAAGTDYDFFNYSQTSPTQWTVTGVPASLTASGDLHTVRIDASGSTEDRGVLMFRRNLTTLTAVLGPPLSTPTITTSGTTLITPRATFASQSSYGSSASVSFQQSSGAGVAYAMMVTAGYLGGTPAQWSLEPPDLSGVAGFPADALFTSSSIDWYVEATSGLGATVLVGGGGEDGTSTQFAGRTSPIGAGPGGAGMPGRSRGQVLRVGPLVLRRR